MENKKRQFVRAPLASLEDDSEVLTCRLNRPCATASLLRVDMEERCRKVLTNVQNKIPVQEDCFLNEIRKIGNEEKKLSIPPNQLNAVQSGTCFTPPQNELENAAGGAGVITVPESKLESHNMIQSTLRPEHATNEEIKINKARCDTRVLFPDSGSLPADDLRKTINDRKGFESELFVDSKCFVDTTGQRMTMTCSLESPEMQQKLLRTEHDHCTMKERPETLPTVHDSLHYPEPLGSTVSCKKASQLQMTTSTMKSKPTLDSDASSSGSKKRKSGNRGLSLRETTQTKPENQTFCDSNRESERINVVAKDGEARVHDGLKPDSSKAPWEEGMKGKEVVHTVSSVVSPRCRQKRPWKLRVTRPRLLSFVFKYCLFVINFFFWVTSVVAIAVGAWVLKERGQLVRDTAAFYLDPSAMLCFVGAVTFIVAFIGCLGALRENICLLKTFQVSMIAVLLLEAVVGVVVFVFYAMPEVRRHIKTGPEEVIKMAVRLYHDDAELQRWIDLIQTELKCCGASNTNTGYVDWTENPYFNCTPHNPSVQRCAVPRSCCIIERGEYINDMCGFDTTSKEWNQVFDRIYTQGCMKGLGLWLSSHDVTIGAISLGIISPQIVCVILARQLITSVRRQQARCRRLD